MRKLLCPEGYLDPLLRQAGGLSLSPEIPVWFDLREFSHQIDRARTAEEEFPERALEHYRTAARLYRGPFLENVYEDWTLLVREQAERSYFHALGRLAAAALANRQWEQAHEYSSRGLRDDPLSREFSEFTMQSLIGLQRHQDALAVFADSEKTLLQELGQEPTTEMLRLREMAKLGI